MVRKHPVEHNAAIVVERVKARWPEEECLRLARREAEAVLAGVPPHGINAVLYEAFPERSGEAIKGRRRFAAHRGMVANALEELRAERNAVRAEPRVRVASDSTTTPSPDPTRERLLMQVRRGVGDAADPAAAAYKGARLAAICQRAIEGEIQLGDILAWLRDVFPPVTARSNARRPAPSARRLSKRTERRREYAATQRLFSRSPKAVAEAILEGRSLHDERKLPGTPGEFERFWRGVFEGRSKPLEHENLEGGATAAVPSDQIWGPVTPEEVLRNRCKAKTAAGPDGLSAKRWNQLPATLVALVFNLFLLWGELPADLTRSRTVFVPKTPKPTSPADFRPISVGSVIVRHFHKILASRLQAVDPIGERQRAFRRGVDGVAENLCVLQALVADARRRAQTLHVASLDVSKAFDTVSHFAILEALRWARLPDCMVRYVEALYTTGSTILQVEGVESTVRTRRGVKQGDPLSPFLFNLVLDRALTNLSRDVGYSIGGERVSALLFADDTLLCSSTKAGMQQNLDALAEGFARAGLALNTNKCRSLSLVADGRNRRVRVMDEPLFRVGDVDLPQVDALAMWRYLGVSFQGPSVAASQVGLGGTLEKLSRAAVKPQQRLHLLRYYVLPRYQFALVAGRVSAGSLLRLDRLLRRYVRTWLALPKDVPNGYVHAPIPAGGLGIPLLSDLVPLLRLKQLERLRKSAVGYVRACADSFAMSARRKWCRDRLRAPEAEAHPDFLAGKWSAMLHSSVDGRALSGCKNLRASSEWIRSAETAAHRPRSGSDYVHMQAVRINALPSRVRTSRGRHDRANIMCRAGCKTPESSAHVVQQCFRTHGGRVLRHNKVNAVLAGELVKLGYKVHEEPRIMTDAGLRKPDIVAIKGGIATVIDAQVVACGPSQDAAHRAKIRKYRDECNLSGHILRGCLGPEGVFSVRYASCTVSWRGVWSPESGESLRQLGISPATLSFITTIALRGSWLNWVRFNQMTAVV
jgi:hypothetical protein